MNEVLDAGIAVAVPPAASIPRRRLSFRAVFGLTVLIAMGAAAVLAPQIAPWDPTRQMLRRSGCALATTIRLLRFVTHGVLRAVVKATYTAICLPRFLRIFP